MRTKPLLGQNAWFGPKRLGWGLSPVSSEGWALSAVAVVSALGLAATAGRYRWTSVLPVIVLLVIVFLKGTSPGGPREWQQFQDSRNRDR